MSHVPSWSPTASLENLRAVSALTQQVRAFFEDREVLEVQTPLMQPTSGTDVTLHPFSVAQAGHTEVLGYLQTSPEFAMKRLLCAYPDTPIYQICKAFRAEEAGRQHRTEFTMLEWYRPHWDHHALIDEVGALLTTILKTPAPVVQTYAQWFAYYLDCCPHTIATDKLTDMVQQHTNMSAISIQALSRDDLLMLLFTHCIEPHIGFEAPAVVVDYPASQAALAKVCMVDGLSVASRFEVYVQGVELANGYHELTCPQEQLARFKADNQVRAHNAQPELPIDEKLLAGLTAGMPDCAGVALGIDRLMMLALSVENIAQVQSFA